MEEDKDTPTTSNDDEDNNNDNPRNNRPPSSIKDNGDDTSSNESVGRSTSPKPESNLNNPPIEASNLTRTRSLPDHIRTEMIPLRVEESNRRPRATSKFSLCINSIIGNITLRSNIHIRDSNRAHGPLPESIQNIARTSGTNEVNAELTVLYSDNVSYTSSESLIAKDGMGYSLIHLGHASATQDLPHSSNTTSPNQPPPYHVATARDTASVQLTPAAAPPLVLYSAPPLQGAPPTYSALMRIGPPEVTSRTVRLFSRRDMQIQPSAPFIAPQPPPSYAQAQGFCVSHPLQFTDAQDYVWGNEPVTLICPYCNNFIVTSVHFRRSNLTHYSALALCICGCWPCCLLPYCMKSCKSAHHECPICSNVVGIYSPWQVT